MAIRTRPATQTSPRTRPDQRAATVVATSAVSAPRPSSQARASVEKYAASGSEFVLTTDHTNDASVSAASTPKTSRRGSARRRATSTRTSSSAGQTR